MDGGGWEAAPEGNWRENRGESSSGEADARPVEASVNDAHLAPPVEPAHLAPAFRGLGPRYCLPRVHLKSGDTQRPSPALVWAQECGFNLISVHLDGRVSSLPRIACKGSQKALERQRSASDGERHRLKSETEAQIVAEESDLGQLARWHPPPPPPLVTKEQLLTERLRSHALHRSLLSLNSFSSSSQTSSSSSASESLPSCSCCLANLRATNVLDPTSPCAFTEISPARPRKRRCSCNWWTIILLCSSSLILLALGLLYLCQTTHMMEHGVAEY